MPITLAGEDGEVETINDTTALWQRPKGEIEDQQYKDLYQSMSHAMDEPLTWSHNRVEGKYVYTSLFFIPRYATVPTFMSVSSATASSSLFSACLCLKTKSSCYHVTCVSCADWSTQPTCH